MDKSDIVLVPVSTVKLNSVPLLKLVFLRMPKWQIKANTNPLT